LKDNAISYAVSGYSSETKAVSGSSLPVNGVFESFKNVTIRIRGEQAEVKDQLYKKPQVKKQCHQNADTQMHLERLIRSGFYPF
jgi:hypothetical protein